MNATLIRPRPASGTGKRTARRRVFIDKPFQLAMAGNMLLAALVCMLLTALAVSFVHVYFLDKRLWADLDTVFWTKAGILAGFVLTAVAVWIVHRTHSIAGPVWKIRRILQDAANGRFPDHPVRFRKGDAFQELADDVNRCLEVMRRNGAKNGRDGRQA